MREKFPALICHPVTERQGGQSLVFFLVGYKFNFMSLFRHDLFIGPIDAYIDPPFPVERALITHAHGDHARSGHGHVLATEETIGIMKLRYGENAARNWQIIAYDAPLKINNEVTVTFYPAGHILGSAQI